MERRLPEESGYYLVQLSKKLPNEDYLLEHLSKMLTVLNNIRDAAERYKDYIKEIRYRRTKHE